MPFTTEEVQACLLNDERAAGYNFRESANYKIAVAYLTGNSQSLHGFEQDFSAHLLGQVVYLLENINPPSEKDQLVLDIIYAPSLGNSLHYFFTVRLINFAFRNNSDEGQAAVLQQFKQLGYTDDDIFSYIIHAHYVETEIGIDQLPLKSFLLDYVKKKPALPQSPINLFARHERWSPIYFLLLEEVRPEAAPEYAITGLLLQGETLMRFFADYKKGKYLPGLISYIEKPGKGFTETVTERFKAAVQLYHINQTTYTPLVMQLSLQYADNFTNHPENRWEERVGLIGLSSGTEDIVPCSTAALDFLLHFKKESVADIVNGWLDAKQTLPLASLALLQQHLANDAVAFLLRALPLGGKDMSYYRDLLSLLGHHYSFPVYADAAYKLANSKLKSLRELVAATIVQNDAGAEKKAVGLLNHKNAEIRQTAALILASLPGSNAMTAIIQVLNRESNDNARDILLQTAEHGFPSASNAAFVSDMVTAANARGKLSKPIEAWLDEPSLPKLYYKDGSIVDDLTTRFLLYRMSRVKAMRSDIEARYVLQLLDTDKCTAFALEIIQRFITSNEKPEHKFLMALAALLGNDNVVDKIRAITNRWIEEGRYKMAEYGVGALALQGSDKALRRVEWYSRKYKNKKANVGAAALVALEAAAEELQISTHELGDRIVPDFGFDGLFKNFTVDGNEYRAFIDSNFKIAFFNEDNKKMKAVPAGADSALKDEFKAISKEVRDITKSQSSRLEYYLIIQRKWNYKQWQQFFLQNPVMFIYATRLLWATYNNEGSIIETFTCNEDTSLVNIKDEEITPAESDSIGIVHPSQLDQASLQQWKKYFFEASIEPIFPQLDRKIPDTKDIDLLKPVITKFDDKAAVTGSVRSTLEKYGWHKGPVGDGGMIDHFGLQYAEKKIEAILEVSGVGAGFGWTNDEKLGRLYFIDKTKSTGRWFRYPKTNDDPQLIQLKDIPAIFFNEALAAIESVKQAPKEADKL